MAPRRGPKCICGQNVINVILPVSGLGTARVNHKAEFCMVGLNQKIHMYHPTEALNIP